MIIQAEKELQITKSQVYAARLSNIRSLERRCLNLDLKISSQNLIISSLKSEMDRLDSDYLSTLQKVRQEYLQFLYHANLINSLDWLEQWCILSISTQKESQKCPLHIIYVLYVRGSNSSRNVCRSHNVYAEMPKWMRESRSHKNCHYFSLSAIWNN